ncbi:MAG: hypothetical protein RIT27_1521 [Pseudomonadota bacterium]|jgi:hypothetical protein
MQHKWQEKLSSVLMAFPIIGLAISGLSWLHFGVDLPYLDDWRAYREGAVGSLDLKYLFTSANDTLYPVGKMLDSLAYRFLNGNSIAYQFISMIGILGSLLFLQWKLLSLVLKEKLLIGSAFSLSVLVIQPGTYWGLTDLAYHQAIPLVMVLLLMYLILKGTWRNWYISIIIILGLVAGFSYISGAFAIFVLSIVLLIFSLFIEKTERKPVLIGGLSLLIPAIITTLAQIWVIAVVQKGTHRPDAPLALPIESDFWFFTLGKVARSLMLSSNEPILSLVVTSLILALVFVLIFAALNTVIKNKKQSLETISPILIFISIFGIVFIYLMLVSAGRTNLRPENIKTPLEIFSFGFHRFHFFWVTIFWSWVIAIIFLFTEKYSRKLQHKIALIIPLIIIPLLLYSGVFDHDKYFQYESRIRIDGIICINQELQKGTNISCPQLYPAPLRSALLKAKETNASFARFLPISNLPFFRMSEDLAGKTIQLKNVAVSDHKNGITTLQSESNDPMIIFSTGIPKKMAKCKTLEIEVSMRVSQSDRAQIFFMSPNQTDYQESASTTQMVYTNNEFRSVVFTLNSPNGFVDKLRFDPVTTPQKFEIKELEVRCRV